MSTPTRTAPGTPRALAGFTQAILDTAGEAIVSLDRRGVVRSFNRAAERMFGWKAADVVGGHVDRLMPRPEDTRREDHLSAYLAVGGPLLKDALGTPHALKLAGYGILTFTAAAVTFAALLDRAARVLERVREDLRAAVEA